VVYARADQISVNKQTSQEEKGIIQNNNSGIFINEKINLLEKKLEGFQKQYDVLLESQRHNYNVNVTVLIALLTFACLLTGLSLLYNFYIAEQKINKALEIAKSDFQKQIKVISGEILANSKEDYKKLDEYIKKELTRTEANYYDSCGRAFLFANPEVAIVWFLRGIKKYLEFGSPDNIISQEIAIVNACFKKAIRKGQPILGRYVLEVENNISFLDEARFPLKKELQEALNTLKKLGQSNGV